MVALPLTAPVAAAPATPAAVYTAAATADDAEDIVPTVSGVQAALTVLGAPPITEMEILDNALLADFYDDGARFVTAPTGDTGGVTMTVLAWIVEDGDDEHADFLEAVGELKKYGPTRNGAWEVSETATASTFGANEAVDVVVVGISGGKPSNLLLGRLARFGKAVTFVSADLEIKGPEIREDDKNGIAAINTILAKLVADNAR